MASYDKQYGPTPTDEYGNPIRRTDEYGNPVGPRVDEYGNPLGHHTTTTGTTTVAGGYAPHDFAATTAAGQGHGVHGHDYDRKEHHGVTGAVLHRSGSSSSSSSEDDGLGGRRKKKGLKEKVREKLPGGTKTDTTYGGTGTTGQHYQEKGMTDKIKEKLPGTGGHRADDPYKSQTHTTATTTPYGGTAYTEEHHEKKGIMDKIKEKLPGQH
ncbi:hypothetical protein ACE6H2_024696 [Prunus campanulata]